MTQKDILLMCPLHKPTQERLEDTYPRTRRLYAEADKAALIEKLAPTCEVIVTSGGVGIDAATLDRMPKVRLVSLFRRRRSMPSTCRPARPAASLSRTPPTC